VVWSGTSVIDLLCPLTVTLPATMAPAPVPPETVRGPVAAEHPSGWNDSNKRRRPLGRFLENRFRMIESATPDKPP
jgi:hypothetical protein